MTSWIRRRFDSTESDDIPESPEPVENCSGNDQKSSFTMESEIEPKKSGVTKVKTQWQRAVRKLSVNSSGYGSASPSEPSPSISLSGSRASMEKPAWLLKQHANCQPRSRHMSINVDGYSTSGIPGVNIRSAAAPIPEGRPVYHHQKSVPSTSLPPYAGIPRYTPEINKSRTPSGSSESNYSNDTENESENEKMSEEFPYGPKFRAAMGRITTFPDGTEAVMIDSALALEAFQSEDLV